MKKLLKAVQIGHVLLDCEVIEETATHYLVKPIHSKIKFVNRWIKK